MELKDLFQPARVGAAKVRGYEVLTLGYALGLDGQCLALAFAESKTRCQAVWAAFLKGDPIEIQGQGKRGRVICRREKGKDLYETLQGDLPGAGGYVTLLLHRAALTAYFAEPPDPKAGRFQFFYAFGPAAGDSPYPIWLAQLRQLLLLPEQPGWADALWPEAVKGGLAQRLTQVAGFAPLWRIEANEAKWMELYSRLACEGRLTVDARASAC